MVNKNKKYKKRNRMEYFTMLTNFPFFAILIVIIIE